MVLWLILGILALLIMGFLIIRISIELEYSDKSWVYASLGLYKNQAPSIAGQEGKKTADKKARKLRWASSERLFPFILYIGKG